MEVFVWDRNFATGLDAVDQQHQHMVELINRLGEALIAGSRMSADALRASFDQLAAYARDHFAEEEQLMREAGVDPRHRDQHQRHHQEFVEQLAVMWSARGTMRDPADTLHGFLRSWLGFHILGVDQAMARQIANIRAGEAPGKAYETESAPKDRSTAALLLALGNLYQVLSRQNRNLADVNLRLEEKVAERTRELALANQTLTDLNLKLEALSQTDGLLGIANRRHFDLRLEAEWQRARRERQPLALLMIDLDYFKRYNDTYGHQAGDRCLQAVAQAARSALKRPVDLLARYGGEELVVLLQNTNLAGAASVAEDIRRSVAGLGIAHADSPAGDRVTVSIGAASVIPGRRDEPLQLVAAADRALYAAKAGGRNRVAADAA